MCTAVKLAICTWEGSVSKGGDATAAREQTHTSATTLSPLSFDQGSLLLHMPSAQTGLPVLGAQPHATIRCSMQVCFETSFETSLFCERRVEGGVGYKRSVHVSILPVGCLAVLEIPVDGLWQPTLPRLLLFPAQGQKLLVTDIVPARMHRFLSAP
jgi:hypothetical protein